jgi:hypothetical protein
VRARAEAERAEVEAEEGA